MEAATISSKPPSTYRTSLSLLRNRSNIELLHFKARTSKTLDSGARVFREIRGRNCLLFSIPGLRRGAQRVVEHRGPIGVDRRPIISAPESPVDWAYTGFRPGSKSKFWFGR